MKSEKGEILEIFLIGFLIIVIVGLIVVLISSIVNEINYGDKEGIVIDKKYNKPHTTTTYMHTGKIIMPVNQYHPESWEIQIKKEVDEKEKTIWISIDENTYNNLEIGDYFKEAE